MQCGLRPNKGGGPARWNRPHTTERRRVRPEEMERRTKVRLERKEGFPGSSPAWTGFGSHPSIPTRRKLNQRKMRQRSTHQAKRWPAGGGTQADRVTTHGADTHQQAPAPGGQAGASVRNYWRLSIDSPGGDKLQGDPVRGEPQASVLLPAGAWPCPHSDCPRKVPSGFQAGGEASDHE